MPPPCVRNCPRTSLSQPSRANWRLRNAKLRIDQLAETPKHVLVATDCLSEGINLQRDFDAVIHYDLSWNPTRHEQREGRVDRYGQPSPKVRVVTYYGLDNQIDGIVLDVLLRKHKKIRSSLGISVPVPVDTEQIVEAVFEGLLLRNKPGTEEQMFLDFEDYFRPAKEDLFAKWDMSAEREKRSRTMFAQEGLSASVEEVERELTAVRQAIGSGIEVSRFTKEALLAHGAVVAQNGVVKVDLAEIPRGLRDALATDRHLLVRFEPPTKAGELLLTRTHPVVEGLAGYLLDTALDPQLDSVARRCGAIRTRAVTRRTTVLLLRFATTSLPGKGARKSHLLAEDCLTVAFEGSPVNPTWLDATSGRSASRRKTGREYSARPGRRIHPQGESRFRVAPARASMRWSASAATNFSPPTPASGPRPVCKASGIPWKRSSRLMSWECMSTCPRSPKPERRQLDDGLEEPRPVFDDSLGRCDSSPRPAAAYCRRRP